MFGCGWEALQDVREWSETLLNVREWSRGPPRCSEVVGRPFRMSGSGRKFLPEVREALSNI